MLFLKRSWKSLKKYWQAALGLIVFVWMGLKLWSSKKQSQSVLQNEIQTQDDIVTVLENHDATVSASTSAAVEAHGSRVEVAAEAENSAVKAATEELDDRVEDNRSKPVRTLANRLGASLGVSVVLPEKSDEN